ncbi:MAG: hypothetical protein RL383_1281 [Actinomycetota bacterium]|jgi:trans-aconitate methyltransferase
MSSAWAEAYESKSEEERSWTQPVPTESLSIIDSIDLAFSSPFIDVGGGASYLVDNLVDRGFTDVTLLDLSPAALEQSQNRNGERVNYVAADVTKWRPDRSYALWHDRAVFHFLTDPKDQDTYIATLAGATVTGSHVVIATFAPDGPTMCSGLPVTRWSAEDLTARFSPRFTPVSSARTEHITPWGSVQPFTFVHLVRSA